MTRAMLFLAGIVLLSAALGASAVVGYRLGHEAGSSASRHVSAAMAPVVGEKPDAAATIAADVGEGVTVLVSGMRFQPEVVRIKAGQSVVWTFNDPGVLHSVRAFDGSFDSGLRSSGSFAVRFDRPGTYCYQCTPHPGRNLCEQAAVSAAGPQLLTANPLPALGAALLNRMGGGGHMQGKIVVEE